MLFGKYDLDKIIDSNHVLRKVHALVSFSVIASEFSDLVNPYGRKGYGLDAGIKGLFLQFYYDLSDRHMEERLRHDIALRWFCGKNEIKL